jgi:hypothetical protein
MRRILMKKVYEKGFDNVNRISSLGGGSRIGVLDYLVE